MDSAAVFVAAVHVPPGWFVAVARLIMHALLAALLAVLLAVLVAARGAPC